MLRGISKNFQSGSATKMHVKLILFLGHGYFQVAEPILSETAPAPPVEYTTHSAPYQTN